MIKLCAEKNEEFFGTGPTQGVSFPFFQKFSEMFGVDLTQKEMKSQRQFLKLPGVTAVKIFQQTGCSKVEDYVIELGENSEEFQQVYLDVLKELG